jgi:hypothetical protein
MLWQLILGRFKFVSPGGTQLSIPAEMVNSEHCEVVIQEVKKHTTLERVDVSDNHFDDNAGKFRYLVVIFEPLLIVLVIYFD